MKTFRALRNRSFTLLWIGQTTSVFGNALFNIALAWWVLEITGSAVAMGTILVAGTVPLLLFTLFGGVAVDRFPRIRLMLISDTGRFFLLIVMGFLAYYDLLAVWHLYIFAVFFGTVSAFFGPAFRAVLPELTPQEDLPSANSLFSLSTELSGIAGPALGALLIATIGTPVAFMLDGLTFLASTFCLIPLLKFDHQPVNEEESDNSKPAKNILADLREGLKTVTDTPWLWVTILIAGLSNISYAGAMDVGLPFLIDEHLEAGVGVLGSFYSISSIGAVVGAIWLGRYDRFRHRGVRLFGWWAPIGICVMLLGFPIGVTGTLIVAFIIGLLNAHLGLVWTNMLQECVPRELLGRVSSVDFFGSYLLNPVGLFVGGLAISSFGPAPVFVVGGIMTAVLIAMGLLHPEVRALD